MKLIGRLGMSLFFNRYLGVPTIHFFSISMTMLICNLPLFLIKGTKMGGGRGTRGRVRFREERLPL